jgi:hypothetical protein
VPFGSLGEAWDAELGGSARDQATRRASTTRSRASGSRSRRAAYLLAPDAEDEADGEEDRCDQGDAHMRRHGSHLFIPVSVARPMEVDQGVPSVTAGTHLKPGRTPPGGKGSGASRLAPRWCALWRSASERTLEIVLCVAEGLGVPAERLAPAREVLRGNYDAWLRRAARGIGEVTTRTSLRIAAGLRR